MQQVMIETRPRQRRLATWGLWVIGAIVFVSVLLLSLHWPFSEKSVLSELADASQTRVTAASYHGTYFPRPGCVLEHVTFQHNLKPGSPPLITVDILRIEGSFSGLFTKHLKSIRASGLRLLIPPFGTEHFQTPPRSTFVIDELSADGANMEVAFRDRSKPPLKFSFHSFAMHEVGSNGPATFAARFSNPAPPGEVTTEGKFGPWNDKNVGETPVSGKYAFQNADLGILGGIGGILSSTGEFSGLLNHIEASGHIHTPQFKVATSSHQVDLSSDFRAVVNGENGDSFLDRVTAQFLNTTISSHGSIASQREQGGKTASLELSATNGRIQDLLLLFTQERRAPMSGAVSFRAHAKLPPGDRPFLEKVELKGAFGIDDGAFAKADTQAQVNRLSKGGLDDKGKTREPETSDETSETVLSNLKGQVSLKNGSATFSNLSFAVPGAQAQMHGTYNVITTKIDLHGTLKTDSEPAKTTRGIKTVMLKVLEPFFKKKRRGYAMPVKITGTYHQPSFGLDLMHGNEGHVSKQAAQGAPH